MKTDNTIWNLDDILTALEFPKLFKKISSDLKKLTGMVVKLKPGMGKREFITIIDFTEQLSENLARLYDMPALRETVDQQDTHAKKLKEQAKDLAIKVEDAMRPLNHWLKGKQTGKLKLLDAKNAKRLFTAVPKLSYILERQRTLAKYTLSEPEEKIISRKDSTGTSVLLDMWSVLETEQTFEFKLPGKKPLTIQTESELRSYVFSPKPEEREAAYNSLFETYKHNLPKYFLIYQSVIKDWANDAELRGYKSPLAVRNIANDLEDSTVQALIEVVQEYTPLFRKFFELKAKVLKVKKLRRFDLYAPVAEADKKVSFPLAQETVLEVLNAFHKPFHDKAKQIITEKHIDSHPAPNKQSGAFCATISPKISPYILLNYSGSVRDVSTLAHELGHGIHSLYSNVQAYSGQNAPLPLAETASTLSEMLMFDHELEHAAPELRKSLLFNKIGDIYATIMRQIYFVMFEIDAHKAIQKGITAEELSTVYMENLQKQFGDSILISADFRYEWSYVPHFVKSPFYVYAYAFGELLALSLYSLYKQHGKKFIPKIEQVLTAGGSAQSAKILQEIGLDFTKRDFWRQGFKIVDDLLAKLASEI